MFSGQTVTIQKDGTGAPASGQASQSGKLSVLNNYTSPFNIGLNAKINGSSKPCYVSPEQVIVGGTIDLIPENDLKVWFQVDSTLAPGTGEVNSGAVEVVYSGPVVDHEVTYKGDVPGGGEWVVTK